MISSRARSFNVCKPEEVQQEEPLQYLLERQGNQIGNLPGMLMELKEKLENAVEKDNVEKESAGSDEGFAKRV